MIPIHHARKFTNLISKILVRPFFDDLMYCKRIEIDMVESKKIAQMEKEKKKETENIDLQNEENISLVLQNLGMTSLIQDDDAIKKIKEEQVKGDIESYLLQENPRMISKKNEERESFLPIENDIMRVESGLPTVRRYHIPAV